MVLRERSFLDRLRLRGHFSGRDLPAEGACDERPLIATAQRLGALAVPLFLVSCAGPSLRPPTLDELGAAWLRGSAAVTIHEAYADDDELICSFEVQRTERTEPRTFRARGTWSPDDDPDDREVSEVRALVVAMHFIDAEEYDRLRARLSPVRRLPSTVLGDIRARIAEELAPTEPGRAVQLEIGPRSVVLFRDDQRRLAMVDSEHRPDSLEVVAVHEETELVERTLAALSARETSIGPLEVGHFAAASGLAGERIPFVYFDPRQRLAVGLATPDATSSRPRGNEFVRHLENVYYLAIDGHLLGIATRPVSSAVQLVARTADTLFDLLKPSVLQKIVEQSFDGTPIPPVDPDAEPMDLAAWEAELDEVLERPASLGAIEFTIGGEEFFPRLEEAIEAAETSIDVRIFIFDNDSTGVEIADLLKRKSREGVRVRVLLDRLGQIMGEGVEPEGQAEDFVPPETLAAYLTEDSKVRLRIQRNPWLRADHAKTIVIDDRTAFTGGMNLGWEYRHDWHDLMMRIEGPVLEEIIAAFDRTWVRASIWGDLAVALAWFRPRRQAGGPREGVPIRVLHTGVNAREIYETQLRAIRRARREILITNAYFSDNRILFELIEARRRGVDVHVILPVHGNHDVMNASNIVTANLMFRNGIQVHFYRPGMTHVKAAIYDGWLCAGSANFDRLSLEDNVELNIATSDPETVAELRRRLFEADLEQCRPMEERLECSPLEFLKEFGAGWL